MAFPPGFLDDVRARTALVGLVGRRVKLVKRGREHTGLCPFHNEKTPSFTVSEEKGFFHCFGCGAHGDAIGFVMRSEGLSFPEAVERLAGEAGLQVPRESPEARAAARRQAGILDVLDAAATWFQEQLQAASGAGARAYLEERGLDAACAGTYRLGYAPDRRGLLRAALNARGLDDAGLAAAGLIKQAEDGAGPRDYFFNRIIFPITDRRGRVIAFGGRALGESRAKYLNSPETPLFHKSRTLYNLARARQGAHDTGELIVVEGYMDVIALGQAGFPAVVAPLGTAITAEQLAELWRQNEEPILCLDGDAAGWRAALRAAERALPLLRPGRSLRFATLPPGEDPDSLVRGAGSPAMRAVLDAARPMSELIWLMETQGRDLNTPERQAGLIQALDERLRTISDANVQKAYREGLNQRFYDTFGFGAWGRPARPRPPGGARRARAGSAGRRFARPRRGAVEGLGALQAPELHLQRREQLLLAALVNHPELIVEYAEDVAGLTFSTERLNALFRLTLDLIARAPDLDSGRLKCHLSEQGHSGLLGGILRPEVYVHGRFARPEGGTEEARIGVRHILEDYRRRLAASETEQAGDRLADAMTDDALAALEAKQRLLKETEDRLNELDRLNEAGI